MNAEQRQATSAILTDNISLITGPPGTGKTQVVSGAAMNSRLKNQSVLFTSRNHKAIDAVVGRMVDQSGQPLMERTNSKEDPNLNFTFAHAVRRMLSEQCNQDAKEKFNQVKNEVEKLLRERAGRQFS